MLLAFGLAVAGLIFKQIVTLVLAVLIVVIIALPMSAFASLLQRVGIPGEWEPHSACCWGWGRWGA